MKSQDIVILLKLISLQDQEIAKGMDQLRSESIGGDPYSVRNLEALLGISKTEIAQSIRRSVASGIARKDNIPSEPRPHRRNLFDFIAKGLKFVFPAKLGPLQRGLPTAFAAPMLNGLLVSGGTYDYVWPHARGQQMGQSVEPLFRSVPEAALKDERLYEYLALVDAIRLGNQREAGLAADHLKSKITSGRGS
ncbi:hypothetical protein [Rhizobium ruizarguesonis]|uniref:hypothetical protein n=1 Tax=Rhizobium ruizarguesonis TaxID=2081791 RepID=UPI0010307A9C|nr:hypothetical protein [Rhizobium ruizarguesonis]TBY93828.1 hypothetical protein E0H40_02695 [Rhizobium leguminosarum bv. viciae]NEH33270.1 hypothetical protein [Rhizobium ruizarguesonis]TBA76295.1 hypothetical protein ELH54_33265 [Rhizobium ruizarguesonis]TBA97822.1 hypothetical protein ELH50_34760 [Rhizobium ruizarguesonis]TCA32563.1 hypothetical protein E0H66_22795 [Rhizobium leguminosarum bv. viciae]